MSAPVYGSPIDLGNTFGAFLVAVIISSSLYGITCLQAWSYLRNSPGRALIRIALTRNAARDIQHSRNISLSGRELRQPDCSGTIQLECHRDNPGHISLKKDLVTPAIVCVVKIAEIRRNYKLLKTSKRIEG
ncbi:hypothetical protein VNI00_013058 [Paramarasmius palmivorus]|uniref:Uncharacterized protein n=1 Tax=Paramarasmius palmivorus TaxID=297713 RepID=A0AAW0C0B5_9AGAR